MTRTLPRTFLLLLVAVPLLLAGPAGADAPPPKPPEKLPGPEAAPGASQDKPKLQDIARWNFSAALLEARKAAAAHSATRADKERLAALCLLVGQAEEARRLLAELFPARDAAEAPAALAAAVARLDQAVSKQPARKRGERYKPEEVSARIRLALAALAADRPADAYEALEPVGACQGKEETLRLALLGLASAGVGETARAARLFEDLARRVSAGAELGVRALALVDSVRSYGVYTERAAKTCRVGETLVAYCEVLNFACRPADDGNSWVTALDLDLAIEDDPAENAGPEAAAREPAWQSKGFDQIRHRTRSEIRDLHLVIRVPVPRNLEAGKVYWLKVTVRDAAAGKSATSGRVRLEVAR